MSSKVRALIAAAIITAPGLPANAADVLQIADYGKDGGQYYQIVCSDRSIATIRMETNPDRACVQRPGSDEQCTSGTWSVREAAVKACQ